MSGFGGLNKSPSGVVIGLIQLQLPDPKTKGEIWSQTLRIVSMVGKARRGYPSVFIIMNLYIYF
jgi:formamidase